MQGGQGPAAQAMPMNYPYAMAQHATPFHQMAQQHMPQPMAYNDVRHGQVNPQQFQIPPGAFVPNYAGMQSMQGYGYNHQGMQYMQQIPHQMMQPQPQPSQPHQMTQHSAHTSSTPPIQPQQPSQPQQPAPHQTVPQPHLQKPKNKAIKIIDPNTLSEIDVKAPATASSEPTESVQNKEKRNHFKEQVLQTVKEPGKSAPHTSPSPQPQQAASPQMKPPGGKTTPTSTSPVKSPQVLKQTTTPPVEIKKPDSPASSKPAEPAKTITPKAILPRSNSQPDDKTPEKQGIEMSVQTTPSLAKVAQTSPATASSEKPEIAAPKFESPPQPETKKIEKKPTPVPVETHVKSENKPEIVETDGETITVLSEEKKDSHEEKAKEEVKVKPKEDKAKEEVTVKPKEEKTKEEVKVKSKEETKQKGGSNQTKGAKQRETAKPKEVLKPKEVIKSKDEIKPKEVSKSRDEIKPKDEGKPKELLKQREEPKPKDEIKPTEVLNQEMTPKDEVKPKEAVKQKEDVPRRAVDDPKVNGVFEKVPEKLTIEIPNGKEILPQEDVPSSEESSECKDQFMTPPATPSEVKPYKKPEVIEQEVKPEPEVKPEVVKPSPIELSDVVPMVAPAVAPTKLTEAVSETKVEVKAVPPPVEEVKIPEIIPERIPDKEMAPQPPTTIDVAPQLEEGEIIEEETTPTGHFRYSREEMVALREAQDKPLPNIPKFDCIMAIPILKAEPIRPRPSNQFVPTWEKESGNRSRSRGGGDRNRSMDKNMSSMSMKPRIIEHTLAPVVTRKKSHNAWLSKREEDPVKKEVDVSEMSMKTLRGNIVAILNKITPQNFKELSVRILQLGICNMEKLEIAVEIIFEKAVLEPAFSQTYANLCKIMSSIKFPDEQNPKISPFRKTLLNRCQKEFFREKTDEDSINKLMDALNAKTDLTESQRNSENEELLYQKSKLKKKMLGNINFIGELFNLGMLSSKIILTQCIVNLLGKKDKQGKVDDEVVECLSKLYGTVGKKLEEECNDDIKKNMFDKTWHEFKSLSTDSRYPYRIRFMIQDVMELRSSAWVPRRVEVKPQRIEDIHREHAEEEHNKKMEATLAASTNRKSKSRTDSRDERHMRGSRDGREKEYVPKKITTPLDMSKLATQKLDSSSLILGPTAGKWGRGSGTGSGTNSPLSGSKEDLTAPTNNRFDMLGKAGHKQKLVPGRTSSAPAPRKNTMERERASALASAHAIASSGRRTPSQSPVRTGRTPSRSPDRAASDRAASQPKDLPDELIKSKTKSIISEYFDIEEMEEAVDCVKEELKLVKKHHIFVQAALNLVIEAKAKNITLLGELFAALFKEQLMNADGLLNGFQTMFESAQDLAIDVPGIYTNLGKLMGESFAKEHLTLKVIRSALEPLRASDKAGVVMCETIKTAVDVLGSKGSMEVQQRWGKEKMSWSDLCDKPADLIEKYKFDYLSSTTEPKEDVRRDADVDITYHLRALLQDDKKNKDDVFTYIDKTVTVSAQKECQFIKDLMTVAFEFCCDADVKDVTKYEISEANFNRVSPILMKYLQSGKDNLQCEVYALDAIQLSIHNMKHPRSLASQIFIKLDDGEIVSEVGFKHWRDNGEEQQGHGVMRSNLKLFFEELSNNDSDSDNSETPSKA